MKHRDSPPPSPAPPTRGPGPTEARVQPASTISSAALLAGAREVLIRHGDEAYRLRLTASNKLILTK
ncbi:MAG: hemin uptake protein HemP [Roseococcus sp.]|nr:hemin uptake protein HemP [Roseococcus sp.]